MARTNTAIRAHIDAIVDIRRNVIPLLQKEVADRALKLGTGTFRSINFEGFKLVISWPVMSRGYQWKAIALEMQRRHKISDREMKSLMSANRCTRFPGKTMVVSACVDDIKPENAAKRAV
jgi:hypothetical protein